MNRLEDLKFQLNGYFLLLADIKMKMSIEVDFEGF